MWRKKEKEAKEATILLQQGNIRFNNVKTNVHAVPSPLPDEDADFEFDMEISGL